MTLVTSALKVKPCTLLQDKIDEIKSNVHFLPRCEIVKAFLNPIWTLFNLLNEIRARQLKAVY